jgi:hypothetical protein
VDSGEVSLLVISAFMHITKNTMQVNELWIMDLRTYTWQYISQNSSSSVIPCPREQHSASVVDGNVYIFGGKTTTAVLGDFWRLTIPQIFNQYISWTSPGESTNTYTRLRNSVAQIYMNL